MRQIVLDTETTGLDPKNGHRIIEIGCVELIDRMLTGNNFHFYLNPGRQIDYGALKVHGITQEFLSDKPKFTEIADNLLAYINNAELIIHNAIFDISFLNHELSLLHRGLGEIAQYCRVFDTLPYARQLHPGQRNSLDALCKRYGVDNSVRNLHGALLDATLLTHIYLAMTGGQVNLFDEKDETAEVDTVINPHSQQLHDNQGGSFVVIEPSSLELQEHNDLLTFLTKCSGKEIAW